MSAPHAVTAESSEDDRTASDASWYELTLFVSGASDLSARAIGNARLLCDVHLDAPSRLAVVDIHEDPAAVLRDRVIAAPTLIKHRPHPVRRFVGDLTDTNKVLRALELPVVENASAAHG